MRLQALYQLLIITVMLCHVMLLLLCL